MLKEPIRRVRFLTREEAQRLLDALPQHLSDMAAFTLANRVARGQRHRLAVDGKHPTPVFGFRASRLRK